MSNPEWLLTDAEIKAIPVTNFGGNVDDLNIAKAQLEKAEPLIRQDEKKKLVEWLNIRYPFRTPDEGDVLKVPEEDWQALLKEANDANHNQS